MAYRGSTTPTAGRSNRPLPKPGTPRLRCDARNLVPERRATIRNGAISHAGLHSIHCIAPSPFRATLMPANLTPQYHKAEQEYRRASTPDEELHWLEVMLREMP